MPPAQGAHFVIPSSPLRHACAGMTQLARRAAGQAGGPAVPQRFVDLAIHGATKRAILEGMGFETLSAVQAATLAPLLAGRDVLA